MTATPRTEALMPWLGALASRLISRVGWQGLQSGNEEGEAEVLEGEKVISLQSHLVLCRSSAYDSKALAKSMQSPFPPD